jgi:hypothetical protein
MEVIDFLVIISSSDFPSLISDDYCERVALRSLQRSWHVGLPGKGPKLYTILADLA